MEKVSGNLTGDEEQIELPPGFRFHPTDEELITHYLSPKVLDSRFSATAIGEVDLNKVEPWDLPWRAKMGENEWYFFCVRDRKYPTGTRTNRATKSGYWKATGKDKEIYGVKTLVGMKKTLVFYRGRAPKGEKTNWVMHEYRLEGKFSLHNLPKTAKDEWVICRIFHKTSSGKKMHISGLVRKSTCGDELEPSNLPPLMDCSDYVENTRRIQDADKPHVTCFSEQMEDKKPLVEDFNNPLLPSSSSCSKPSDASPAPFLFPRASVPDSLFSSQFLPNIENFQYPDSGLMQDQSIMDFLLQKDGPNMERYSNAEFSTETGLSTDLSSAVSNHEMGPRCFDDQEDPINSAGPVDLDCLWNIY